MIPKTSEEFNEKYKDYLVKGYYGLALNKPEMIEYLDKEFEELIKIPNFKYQQIKSKFNWFCFYAENLPVDKRTEIETKLTQINQKNEIKTITERN